MFLCRLVRVFVTDQPLKSLKGLSGSQDCCHRVCFSEGMGQEHEAFQGKKWFCGFFLIKFSTIFFSTSLTAHLNTEWDFSCVCFSYSFKDHFAWNKVTSCIHNILSGQRWIEHYGEIIIKNLNDDTCHCKLTFIKVTTAITTAVLAVPFLTDAAVCGCSAEPQYNCLQALFSYIFL